MSFISHEPCPACGSKDNLGRYADGSAWCFGCRYYERPNGRVDPRVRETLKSAPKDYSDPPDDLSLDFSAEAAAWLSQYGLTLEELKERGVRYSPSKNQIIFVMGQGIWQARNFGEYAKKRKYFTQGEVNDHLSVYTYGGNSPCVHTGTLVLVEDCVSAIKVARQCDAMPLLGSSISYKKLERINHLYDSVVFWLDADKFKEAQGLSTRGSLLGLSSRVIFTQLDPKEYDDETILELLT